MRLEKYKIVAKMNTLFRSFYMYASGMHRHPLPWPPSHSHAYVVCMWTIDDQLTYTENGMHINMVSDDTPNA